VNALGDFRFNYVRNSVKATVDAYDGTVNFYVMPGDDPIIDAYQDALPDLFSDFDDMPEGLQDHLRYPEDLFEVQTWTWERYHLDKPSEFLDSQDRWRVAPDPGRRVAASSTTATTDSSSSNNASSDGRSGQAPSGSSASRIPARYQLLRLPDQQEAEFVLMRPFVPFSTTDRTPQLTAFMAARMDGANYGKLQVYEMPPDNLPDGPGLVSSQMSADQRVSTLETQLGVNTGGSDVQLGNLLMVPIDNGLLYVRPFYVQAEDVETRVPRLTKVIAWFEGDVVIEDTLKEALEALFPGQTVNTREESVAPSEGAGETETPEGGETPPGSSTDAATLLQEAETRFDEAEAALKDGDLATYDQKLEEARDLVGRALELLGATESASSPSSTTTTSAPSSSATTETTGSAAPPAGTSSDRPA
jgi:hypothetical protein